LRKILAGTGAKLPEMWFYRSQPFVAEEDYDEPWLVPGGLRGLTGWKSYPAASVPNSGWITGASYADGQVFVDMLVNAKSEKIFTLRVRRKVDGGWSNSVPFADARQQPAGFRGAGQACASCHAAKSAPRAKDTVISFLR
jgi:hypothetical protein